MKHLLHILLAIFLTMSFAVAQETYDSTAQELESAADSVLGTTKSADILKNQKYKSIKIENKEEKEDWEDWDDWDNWKASRKKEWRSSGRHGYFRGGAGGWDYYLMDLNVSAINSELVNIGLQPMGKQIYMTGGGGWGFIGHGIRIGGMGAHGQLKTSGNPESIDLATEVTLAINFGGFLIEKVYHPFNKTELYWGTMIGGGNAQLKFEQWGGPVDWDELWGGYNNAVIDSSTTKYTDYQNEISCGYFTVLPSIGFRYNFFRWAAIGINVGYLYSRMNQDGWEMNGKTVTNVPEIDFSNVIYRLNLYFGG